MSDRSSAKTPITGDERRPKQDDSPILLSRINCPVCRTVNEFETVRPGAYVEEGTDTDFRPLSRKWTNARYQSVNPLLYFMATCSTCYYTRELNRFLREPLADSEVSPEQQKEQRLKHLSKLADSDGVVKRLGSSLWPESMPVETAISKLLLGILDENLSEHPSNYDLARWYLRIAWLFREIQPKSGRDITSPSVQSRRDLDRSLDEINADVNRLKIRLSEVTRFLQTHPEAAQRHPDDQKGTPLCRVALQHAAEQIESIARELTEMRQTLLAPPEKFVGGGESAERGAFGDYASFSEFLRSLKLDSSLIPTNEDEALALSLSHYKLAFEAQGGMASGNGTMLTAYLIGELSRRLAQFDDAERFLDMARVAAHAAISENGHDKPRSALARHLAALAEKQAQALYFESNVKND